MASWKDGTGQYTWGTYLNTATYDDIAVVGGAKGGGSDYFGISESEMDTLRAKEYGTGIHFWRDGNKLNITINLIIITLRNNTFLRNGYYIGNSSEDYKFLANIQYKTKQGNWVKLGDNEISTFYGGDPMYDKADWDTKGSGYLWKTFTFDNIDLSQVTQFSVGVHGEGNEIRKWNYYNIEDVLKPTRKVNLRIKYVDAETGRELASPIVYSLDAGTSHREEAKVIQGYTPRQTFFQLNINEDTEFTFHYYRNREYRDVTVEYVEEGTGRKLRDSIVLYRQEVGTNVSAPAQPIQGYYPDSSYKTILVGTGTNVIRFIYHRNVTYVRPWAIRKAGLWKSFTTNNTNMIRRVAGSWSKKDTSMDSSLAGSDKSASDTNGNKSASYIRKSGNWKRQGKVGN